jgi:hypothetical protein
MNDFQFVPFKKELHFRLVQLPGFAQVRNFTQTNQTTTAPQIVLLIFEIPKKSKKKVSKNVGLVTILLIYYII